MYRERMVHGTQTSDDFFHEMENGGAITTVLGVRPVPHDMRRGPITCRFGTVSRSEIKVISRRELQSTVLTEVVVCIGAPLCT